MDKEYSRLKKMGAVILIGAVLSTAAEAHETPPFETQIMNSAEPRNEETCYVQAMNGGNKADVVEFLRTFRESTLVLPLLLCLPPATLATLPLDVLNGLSSDVIASLPYQIRMQLGIETQTGNSSSDREVSGGYAG